jgi:hypothetical protein
MIVLDILKGISGSISKARKERHERDKRIDHVVSVVEFWENQDGGRFAFVDFVREMKTEIAVMKESIGMIKSFFNIYDRRKQKKKVKIERRKTEVRT